MLEIKEVLSRPTTKEFDELLKCAVANQGTPDDVESWACRIAHETSKLND